MTAPLTGTRVLVLRAPAQAAALSDRIRALGGEPVEAPVLTITPGDTDALDAAVRDAVAGRFDWLCVTSPNGVDAVADALARTGQPAAALDAAIACVGSGTTARLAQRLHRTADLVSDVATTRALGTAMPPGGGRVLLARAERANPVLDELLTAKGYDCVAVTAYRTGAADALPPTVLDDLAAGRIDLVAVGSSSTVEAFAALVDDRVWSAAVVSIGPVTSATCRSHDIEVAAEADPHDLDGLTAALVDAAGRVVGGPRPRRGHGG